MDLDRIICNCMGIIGQYLAKTYLEAKNRPVYIMGDSSLK